VPTLCWPGPSGCSVFGDGKWAGSWEHDSPVSAITDQTTSILLFLGRLGTFTYNVWAGIRDKIVRVNT
jgi:hypothetical protein